MNNNDLFQASRRRFLAQLGGLTVAGMLGPSLLTPRSATAAQAAAVISKEGILTGSHWGAIRATVKDGRFVAAKPFELDKYPSKMIAGLPDCRIAGLPDCRITYTTRRVFVIRWYAWTGCVSAISAIPPSAVITVLCA
ncbi:tat (twin-arginine translocation) pathway signal sequence domain protein [Shigella dysenteriae 225-75]|nr:tat (twin-arginine translocation) pathway signal sequence domain protein [Shigella dysenteriae 225-75]